MVMFSIVRPDGGEMHNGKAGSLPGLFRKHGRSSKGSGMRVARLWTVVLPVSLVMTAILWSCGSTNNRVDRLVREAAQGRGVDPLFEFGRSGVEINEDFKAIGLAAVPRLMEYLRNPKSSYRRVAADELGLLGAKEAVPSLMDLAIIDRDMLVREAAIGALGDIADASALPALATVLNDPDWRIRAAVARAMGSFKPSDADAILLVALKDPVAWVRAPAAASMGLCHDVAHWDVLVPLLGDEDEWVRRSAAIALARLGRKEGVPELLLALKDKGEPTPSIRTVIVELIGDLGDIRAVDTLRGLAELDRLSEVREAATRALARIQSNH
jgi:HEAT repeat protein